MEATSLHPDLHNAGGRHPSNSGARRDMQELEHDATYTPPRAQPVDIVIPPAIPSPREDHVLEVVQQPEIAKVAAPREKVRTPLDPPLVVELSFKSQESNRTYLSSPFFFGNVELVPEHPPVSAERRQFQSAMIGGSLVSSLHKVRLEDNLDHAFFVFGDLNIKLVGQFRLKFTLFEMHKRDNGDFHVVQLGSILTNVFRAYASRDFPGQMESTSLSKHLCDQGIKLRIRKETSKRKAQSSDWAADHYMHSHGSMSNYSRTYGPFHPEPSRDDQRRMRDRLSPRLFGVNNAAETYRGLPEIPTLPPVYNLPRLSAPPRNSAAPLPLPAPMFPPDSRLPSAARSHLAPSTSEHHGSPAWPGRSTNDGATSYVGKQEHDTHNYGNPSGLGNYQYLPKSGHSSSNNLPHQEVPGNLSHDGQYNRRRPIIPSYNYSPAQAHYDSRSSSFVPDTGRPRVSAPSTVLPPIEPGPYLNGMQLRFPPSVPFQPETASDERVVYPTQLPSRLNSAIGDQEPSTPSQHPEPQN